MMIRITLQYLIITITSITALFSLAIAQPVVPHGPAFPIERNHTLKIEMPPGLPKPPPLLDSGSMQPIIEPGSVQLPELSLKPLQPEFDPNRPQVLQIKTEVINPYTVKVGWSGIYGATSYELYRNDTLITKLSAVADTHWYSFTDDGLSPGYNYSYVVKAIQVHHLGTLNPAQAEALSNKLNLSVAPLGSGQGTDLPKELRQELTTSKPEKGFTPSIVAPHDFIVTIIDPLKRIVRLEWKPPTQWATGVQILRDGVPLGNPLAIVPGASEMSFDDTTVTKGAHTYALKTQYEYDFESSLPYPTPTVSKPGQPNLDTLDHKHTPMKLERRHFDSTLTPDLTLHLAPFKIVAFGDSVMWGQGLAEPAKFTSLTAAGLRDALNVEVELVSFAHSGAIARTTGGELPRSSEHEPSNFNQGSLITPGEVPNSFPTILHQINVQAAESGIKADEIDLVLINGCVNDVGVATIINPNTMPEQLAQLTQVKCVAMIDVLQRAHSIFPKASIVLTGYYPFVSNLSDLTAVRIFVASVVGVPALGAASGAAALGVPIVPPFDPVTIVVAGLIGVQVLQDKLSINSSIFATISNGALSNAASMVNAKSNTPGLVSFVPVPFQSENAYAAPDSWLWLVPTGLYPGDQDDMITARSAVCQDANVISTSAYEPFKVPSEDDLNLARIKCPNASMGHPNHKGAQAYAEAILTELQHHLPRWRDKFASTRRTSF